METMGYNRQTERPPVDMNDVEEYHRNGGGHFFDADSMRFFGSRIGEQLYAGPGGLFFVTSERDNYPAGGAWNGERRYTVRVVTYTLHLRDDYRAIHTCDIDTVGEFGDYGSSRAANTAAARFARDGAPE